MTPATEEMRAAAAYAEVESAKLRCKAVIDQILSRLVPSSSSSLNNNIFNIKNINCSCFKSLLRLAHSELSFLSRSSSSPTYPNPTSLSSNIGHIEAVLHILQQPFVNGLSRVCRPIYFSDLLENGRKCNSKVHVDIVCSVNGKPAWFIVSARNPKYVSWNGPCVGQSKSLRERVVQVVDAAARASEITKPSSIILFFSNGLSESVCQKLEGEFEATKFDQDFTDSDILSEELDGDWVYVLSRSFQEACVYEIKLDRSTEVLSNAECKVKDSFLGAICTGGALPEEPIELNLGISFCNLISRMRFPQLDLKGAEFGWQKDFSGDADLINFDTTALIAVVSGISNGGTEKLLAQSESELRQRFKGNVEFVIAQVMSEIQNPIHADMDGVLSGKRGIICESVASEFKELLAMCGGLNEKSRANHLLKYLMVVPDMPSARMMSLPTTRKLALKNKVVFGTGDYMKAPTLTANMAFVRAVSQTGLPLYTVEHRPRALTGD